MNPFTVLEKKEVWLGFLDGACDANRAVALLEFVNAASRIDKLLLAGEEGMAGGADAELDVLPSGACFIGGAACAHDHGLLVIWMNFWLHFGKGCVS